MGNGWQLNFRWMSNTVANATYIHLWDGEGYRIPSSFWTTGVFENHQGEHFVLSRDVLGFFIDLYTKSGTYYIFTPTTHALLSIVDATRRNQINFGYDSNNRIANVTD